MRRLIVICLTIFAIGLVRSDESFSVCEKRAEACVDNLLSSLLGETSEREVCGELRYAIECLKDTVDDCLGDEGRESAEDGLREIEDLMRDTCQLKVGRPKPVIASRQEQELEVITECLIQSEPFLHECIRHSLEETLSVLDSHASENLMRCAMFGMMAGCYVEKVGEKCGDTAAKIADEELAEPPLEIQTACQLAGGVEAYYFGMPDDKRRK